MRKWCGAGLLFLMQIVSAEKIRMVSDNGSVSAPISATEVTRIYVGGDRIRNFRGIKGAYTRSNNEERGEVYIQPTPAYANQILRVFVETELGRHITLNLKPSNTQSEALKLIIKSDPQVGLTHNGDSTPYELRLVHLIKDMMNQRLRTDYQIIPMKSGQYYLWNHVGALSLHTIYQGIRLRGEIFQFTNHGKTPLYLRETYFYKRDARAISIERPIVQPGEKIKIYRISDNV